MLRVMESHVDEVVMDTCLATNSLTHSVCSSAIHFLGQRPWNSSKLTASCEFLNAMWKSENSGHEGKIGPPNMSNLSHDDFVRTALAGRATHVHCFDGWVAYSGRCFSPPRITSDYVIVTVSNGTTIYCNRTVDPVCCAQDDCKQAFAVCTNEGAEVASKEQLELWIKSGGRPPQSLGVTATTAKKGRSKWGSLFSKDDPYRWVVSDNTEPLNGSWAVDGCCGRQDRYFVCTRAATGPVDEAVKKKASWYKLQKRASTQQNNSTTNNSSIPNSTSQHPPANVSEDAAVNQTSKSASAATNNTAA
eukprot:TRINITY_DN13730_c0_g2_i1.p1 TRINITY_DN13730_c0_g2~~TRINITY_DN13730_c0_g2_i1.p1  ORF type:complete len:304 (+),score=28.79 TRINITY_DN13730_c0_g2_i1:301-1212(+)